MKKIIFILSVLIFGFALLANPPVTKPENKKTVKVENQLMPATQSTVMQMTVINTKPPDKSNLNYVYIPFNSTTYIQKYKKDISLYQNNKVYKNWLKRSSGGMPA